MDNQEKQRDVQQEEKALKLFGLLQNVPEELLERSEKQRPGVIAFIQKYNTTLVACIALLLIGVGFLSCRVGNDAASGETAFDAESSTNIVGDVDSEEYQYVADNNDVADMFQEALTDDVREEAAEPETDGTVEETLETGGAGPVGLVSKLSVLDIPEDYTYDNITSSISGDKEILVFRLENEDGKYMEMQIRCGEPKEEMDTQMVVQDAAGNVMESETGKKELVADEKGVAVLTAEYSNGMVVHYRGTAEAEDVYRILESLK